MTSTNKLHFITNAGSADYNISRTVCTIIHNLKKKQTKQKREKKKKGKERRGEGGRSCLRHLAEGDNLEYTFCNQRGQAPEWIFPYTFPCIFLFLCFPPHHAFAPFLYPLPSLVWLSDHHWILTLHQDIVPFKFTNYKRKLEIPRGIMRQLKFVGTEK